MFSQDQYGHQDCSWFEWEGEMTCTPAQPCPTTEPTGLLRLCYSNSLLKSLTCTYLRGYESKINPHPVVHSSTVVRAKLIFHRWACTLTYTSLWLKIFSRMNYLVFFLFQYSFANREPTLSVHCTEAQKLYRGWHYPSRFYELYSFKNWNRKESLL